MLKREAMLRNLKQKNVSKYDDESLTKFEECDE